MQSPDQEKFNAYCADVMGYYRGQLSAENLYFENGNQLVMPVSEYDPFDDLSQMQPVLDSLMCGLGLHLDSGTTKRCGILIAARSLIFRGMQINIEHSSDNKEVIKGCVGKERFWENEEKFQQIQRFNAFCARAMSWRLGELTCDLDINNDVTAMNFADVRIRRLEALLEQLAENEGWISTEEELPIDLGKVLIQYGEPCWGGFNQEVECAYYEDGIWCFWLSDREVSTNGVTYWQAMPETKEVNDDAET